MSTSYRVGAGELGEDVMIRRRTSFSHQHESENLMPCSIDVLEVRRRPFVYAQSKPHRGDPVASEARVANQHVGISLKFLVH